ncbi:MAG TPA: hypothetical protein VH560_14585, partial [Polyangia bacterium]|nr:hypothetical protein [Polyangia bacterium]
MVLFLCGSSIPARAADDPETLIHEGIELRKAGQDARAEGYFRRAYQLAPTPRTAAQLGLAELAVDDYLNAEAHLSEALAGRDDAWILNYQKVLQDSRAQARRNLLEVEIVGAPAGATLALGSAAPSAMPQESKLWIAPNTPMDVTVSASGHKSSAFHVE